MSYQLQSKFIKIIIIAIITERNINIEFLPYVGTSIDMWWIALTCIAFNIYLSSVNIEIVNKEINMCVGVKYTVF